MSGCCGPAIAFSCIPAALSPEYGEACSAEDCFVQLESLLLHRTSCVSMLDALIPPEINIYLEELSEPTPVLHSSHDVQIEFRVPACPVVSHFASTYVSELTYVSCPVTVSSEEAATARIA